MSKKTQWMRFRELPEEVKPLALAYSKYYDALYHSSNVVRFAVGGEHPVFIVQQYGRICPQRLMDLQTSANCLVEVEAIAPDYYLIYLFGGVKPGNRPVSGMWGYDGEPDGFRCRLEKQS